MIKIGIVIVGYNSQKYLDDCLASIKKSTYKNYNIIFVDNKSTDNSVEYIKKKHPKTTVIRNSENFGFAKANNIGIKKAFTLKSDYVFLLNPDTLVDKDCLSRLAEVANKDTILQPLVLLNINSTNTDLIKTSGGYLNFLGFSYCSDYKKNKTLVKEKDIGIASGVAAFIPVAMFNKIGLFDESFFMYHEDVDLFWRAKLLGYNVKLLPKALVWHKYSFSRNKHKMFYADRNRLLFLYKNFPLSYLILILPVFLLNEIFMILYSLATGWFFLKVKAYCSAIFLIGSKRIRRVKYPKFNTSKSNLKEFIKSDFAFSEVNIPLFKPYNIFLGLYWAIAKKLI